MTSRKKAVDEAVEESQVEAAPEVEDADEPADDGPLVATDVTNDGLRAIDSVDGVAQDARSATFAEQVAKLAPDAVAVLVKSIPWATSADVNVDGSVLTITLYN